MESRRVIAANLKALRAATPKYKTRPVFVEKTGVPNGPLGRIENAATNFGVDYLDGLADAFGIAAWQLLIPGLKVEAGPRGLPVVGAAPDPARYSLEATALAAELDFIEDRAKRTEAWLVASEAIRNHFRSVPTESLRVDPPIDTPAVPRKQEKRRA